jgi:hypothetical protein
MRHAEIGKSNICIVFRNQCFEWRKIYRQTYKYLSRLSEISRANKQRLKRETNMKDEAILFDSSRLTQIDIKQ